MISEPSSGGWVDREQAALNVRIGTAGWAIGAAAKLSFPSGGSNLERYSRVLSVAEINSSFHRPHRPSTWEGWRNSVPESFRFSAKVPKTITHQRKLVQCRELISDFLRQVELLGEKLAILLVQLPPKLAFDPVVAGRFFDELGAGTSASIVVEPRHLSWFEPSVEALLAGRRITRVAADPAISPSAALPGGWLGLEYWRLHGSPIKYRSSYQDRLATYAEMLARPAIPAPQRWCIFDNTASSAAISDAVQLQKRLNDPEH